MVTLLWGCPPVFSVDLPKLTPIELAEFMRLGARSLESLSVEQHAVRKGAPQGGVSAVTPDPKDRTIREYRVVYKMKQHFLLQYSRFTPVLPPDLAEHSRQAAYNGEFFTWQQGTQGAIEAAPSGGYAGMSYLFLRLLYYPTEKESYADFLVPPSVWRVEFDDPTTFEGSPCYVLSLHARPPGTQEEPTRSLCWRLVVCPRFGFATVDRQITLTLAGRSEPRERTEFRRFTEVATGMWLPLECESWSEGVDGSLIIEYRYESVNQPIDDAEFVVRFAPGTAVVDRRNGTRFTVDEDDESVQEKMAALVRSASDARAEPSGGEVPRPTVESEGVEATESTGTEPPPPDAPTVGVTPSGASPVRLCLVDRAGLLVFVVCLCALATLALIGLAFAWRSRHRKARREPWG